MNFKLVFHLILTLLFCVFLSASLACNTTPLPTSTPAPVSTRTPPPTATTAPASPALFAQSTLAVVVSASRPTATATLVPKTIEQVTQGWSNTRYMDYAHLSRGMTCQTCHTTWSPTDARPANSTCIDCHPDSVPAAGVRRRGSTPHNAHIGVLNCFQCHHSHRSFELYCTRCHSLNVNPRFQ
ncbi:Fumarate reductase flavoprotein subunit [Anaerolineae bacterium]|nr:Fumarate reductase flavoprotein subunit [Anaerolineae bacterium]